MTSPFLVLSKLMKRSQMFMAPWTVLVSLALVQPSFSAPVDARRIYTNAEYHFRLMYPAMWHISVVAGRGGPILYNYDLSSAPGHGLLPERGAEIFVLPHSDLSKLEHSRTPREWATADMRRFSQNGLTTNEVGDIGNPEISDVVRVAFDNQTPGDDQAQRYVAYYFHLDGELLKVELTYWKSDSKQASYERTLWSILTSIRGISSKPK